MDWIYLCLEDVGSHGLSTKYDSREAAWSRLRVVVRTRQGGGGGGGMDTSFSGLVSRLLPISIYLDFSG